MLCSSARGRPKVEAHGADPSNTRRSKTIKCDCPARVIIRLHASSGLYSITSAVTVHNHAIHHSPGRPRPAAAIQAHRDLVSRYATDSNFNRTVIGKLIRDQIPDHPLDPIQVTNLMSQARITNDLNLKIHGGDVATLVENLRAKQREDPRWLVEVRLDNMAQFEGLFWMSPLQIDLAKRYGDVLMSDIAANRYVDRGSGMDVSEMHV